MKQNPKNAVCLIAARSGSKGVPNKNIRLLGDKPLIAYAIETALDSKQFGHVIVSTEDQTISKIAKEYGADVPFRRPKSLALDSSSMEDVLLHAIMKLKNLDYSFDILVNRDCTVPFISIQDIQGAISLYNKKNCDLVCSVYRQHHNPYFNMMEKNNQGFLRFSKKLLKSFQTRQSAPIVYQLNGLFVLNVQRFLKTKHFYMPKTLPFEITPEHGFMIDTEFEFIIADLIMKNKLKI